MSKPFYSEGLRFECTRCSRCCRHAPGYVFLTLADLKRMAEAKRLNAVRFFEVYCREIDLYGISRVSLREREDYDCVFWEQGGCSVYEARPAQCRSYPFWSANLCSPEAWAALLEECPGAGHGRLHSAAEIDAWLARAAKRRLLGAAAEIR